MSKGFRGRALAFALCTFALNSCDRGAIQVKALPVRFDGEGVPGWLQETAEECARIASCSLPSWPSELRSASLCVDATQPARTKASERSACMRGARSCAAVEACVGQASSERALQYCKMHPETLSACVGDLWITCGEKSDDHLYIDCAKIAGQCSETRQAGGLLLRGCRSQSLCPVGAKEARCDTAHSVVTCHDGFAERTECAVGTRCESHADGPTCASGSGTKCGLADDSYCEGDTLVECPGSERSRSVRATDCGRSGLRCVARGKQAACRVGVANDCDTGVAQCMDGDLSFCAAGRRLRISCAKLGFAKCEQSLHSLEGACGGHQQ